MKKGKFTVNILYTVILTLCFLVWSLIDCLAPDFVLAAPGPMVVIASVLAALTLGSLLCREEHFHCPECLALAALTSVLLPFAAGFSGRNALFLAGAGFISYTVFSVLYDGMKRRIENSVAGILVGILCYFACQCFKGLV